MVYFDKRFVAFMQHLGSISSMRLDLRLRLGLLLVITRLGFFPLA